MGAVAEGSPSIRAQANLSALGLHEMAASLPDYVRMVAAGERGFASALEEMTRVEVAAREVRITNQRIRSSGFPYVKGLADFDWDFQPSVPRAEIEELATLRFVERAENVLFVGSPGVGKTHLAVALGIGLATLMWTVPGGAQETGGPYMRDPRHPRHFTDEFKRQIVDLYNAGKPKREIMDEYDLGKSTVERWIKSINATGSPRAADNRTPEQNRILELERENRRLRMEVDVLKQAALIYARK